MPMAIRHPRLALNHMAAARHGTAAFFALARCCGVAHVEIRNDLVSLTLTAGASAHLVRSIAADASVSILTINALQRFNDWSPRRAAEARDLTQYARDVGAMGIVLVPVNDPTFTPNETDRLQGLRDSLQQLKPILDGAGIVGLVEPLGFPECALRLKSEAIAAIDAVAAGETFRLVHDTFHHAIAGETRLFPMRTALIHASGVIEPSVPLERLRDAHRVLVDGRDRLDTIGQIRALAAGGCQAEVSLEPFAQSVHDSPTLIDDLSASLRLIETALTS